MKVAVFSDVHAHADALRAVFAAAVEAELDELWSLGDMVGTGPDPAEVVDAVRSYCAVALAGNHDYAATGAVAVSRFGAPGSPGVRSLVLAEQALRASGGLEWLRTRKPAARRPGVQAWHGSPRNPVWEFVGDANVDACLHRQREPIGLVGHTHVPAAWRADRRGRVSAARVEEDLSLDLAGAAKWLLNPGPVGVPLPWRDNPRRAMDRHAAAGAWWLELDLDARVATWRRAPFEPTPARERALSAGIEVA